MTTDDILGSRVQLNELLDISSSDTFTDLGNTVLDDISEVDLNGFKMHNASYSSSRDILFHRTRGKQRRL